MDAHSREGFYPLIRKIFTDPDRGMLPVKLTTLTDNHRELVQFS